VPRQVGGASSGAAYPRRAAGAAGHLGQEQVARDGLSDRSGQVRAAALGSLARMGRLRPEELFSALADLDAEVRRRACNLVPAMPWPTPAEPLVGLLGDSSAGVVEAACWALGEVGGSTGPELVVPALAACAAEHPDQLSREAAVAALGAIGHVAGLPAVLGALRDKPAVRRRAVVALAAFDGEAVEVALQRASKDPDWQVRQVAEDLLGRRSRPKH